MDERLVPVGEAAFRVEPNDLWRSCAALRQQAFNTGDLDAIESLTVSAQWYEDLAFDLAEIQALPEANR